MTDRLTRITMALAVTLVAIVAAVMSHRKVKRIISTVQQTRTA